MKVLLDENLPHRLRKALAAHEVFTVRYQGWSGLKNGELLKTAERGGFELFLTGDQTISYEQNLASCRIAILVLSAIECHIISASLSAILAAIDAAEPRSYRALEIGSFHRKPAGQ